MINGRSVAYKSCKTLLDAGRSICISPGAIYEQLNFRSDQEIAFFPPQLGFIRLAIKYGTPIIPEYTFGENQIYYPTNTGRAVSNWLYKKTGFGVPFVTGMFPFPSTLPAPYDVAIKLGEPVEVGEI